MMGQEGQMTYHKLGSGGTLSKSLLDESIREYDFCQFNCEVVFIRCSILRHGRTDANGGNGDILPHKLFWPPPGRM